MTISLLLWGALCGAALAACYDGLRIRRIATAPRDSFAAAPRPVSLYGWREKLPPRQKRETILLFCEDVLFACLSAAVLLLCCYGAGDGSVRAPVLFAAVGAFVLWRVTVGRVLMRISARLVTAVRVALAWIGKRIFAPLLSMLLCPFRAFAVRCLCAHFVRRAVRLAEQQKTRKTRKNEDENHHKRSHHSRRARGVHQGKLPSAGGRGGTHSESTRGGNESARALHSRKTRREH